MASIFSRWGQRPPTLHLVDDLAKDPRIGDGPATDHHASAAGLLEAPSSVRRGEDISDPMMGMEDSEASRR